MFSPLVGHAATLAECQQVHRESVKSCDKHGQKAKEASDLRTNQAIATCQSSGKSWAICSKELSTTGTLSHGSYATAIGACDDDKRSCDQKCQPTPKDTLSDKSAKEHEKRKCGEAIESRQADLRKAQSGADSATTGGDANAEASQGNPSAMPPMPEQQAQTPEPQEQAKLNEAAASEPTASINPCEGGGAHLHAQCKQQVESECKNGTDSEKCTGFCSGVGSDTNYCKTTSAFQTASLSYCSRSGKEICPGCAGFKKQCLGDAATCLREMPADQAQKIRTTCADGPGGASLEISSALKIPTGSTAATSSGGSTGRGGSAGSTVGTSQAQIDDYLSKLNVEGENGHREGDSLRVDSSGGYSNSPDEGGASSSESSAYGSASRSGPGGRSIASTERSVSASDVQRRIGPSVFSISSEVLRARCARGLFLHCQPGTK